MRVSVVINTYNRAKSLRDTLQALRYQTHDAFEVVVVKGPCTDDTDAVRAMEAGADACLINTAISRSDDPPLMAAAMRQAVIAGRLGYRAGRMPRSDHAIPSSPVAGLVGAGL